NLLAAAARPDAALRAAFIASVNSYLGILRHYKTYRKRRRILNEVVSSFWHKHIVCAPGCRKVIRRKTG
ncbi:MAG: hypothetical protein LBR16_02290, partial [Treponema sp.]|nr:hypothetical protein [Treponema sp.]